MYDLSFNIEYNTIRLRWLRFDEHGRIGLLFEISFDIQYQVPNYRFEVAKMQ